MKEEATLCNVRHIEKALVDNLVTCLGDFQGLRKCRPTRVRNVRRKKTETANYAEAVKLSVHGGHQFSWDIGIALVVRVVSVERRG